MVRKWRVQKSRGGHSCHFPCISTSESCIGIYIFIKPSYRQYNVIRTAKFVFLNQLQIPEPVKNDCSFTNWLDLFLSFKVFTFFASFAESEEADKLEELKKVTAEQKAKTDKRRMKFQAQDSVLVDNMKFSQDEE